MNFTKTWHWVVAYLLADLFCVGAGMGVPLANILFGFVLGWYWIHKNWQPATGVEQLLPKTLRFGLLTSGFTFLVLLAIWGPTVLLAFNPSFDVVEFGHPMILFEPMASFIGWEVLMIVISPFLQLLTTIFAAHVALISKLRTSVMKQPA